MSKPTSSANHKLTRCALHPTYASVLILELSISPLKSLAHCSSDCSQSEHRKAVKLKTKLLTTVFLNWHRHRLIYTFVL